MTGDQLFTNDTSLNQDNFVNKIISINLIKCNKWYEYKLDSAINYLHMYNLQPFILQILIENYTSITVLIA